MKEKSLRVEETALNDKKRSFVYLLKKIVIIANTKYYKNKGNTCKKATKQMQKLIFQF